jgi:hypothetical protein
MSASGGGSSYVETFYVETLSSTHLTIGCFVFPRQDQIDFTGPFEVLSRIPNSTVHVIAKTKNPVRDVKGLILTPEMSLADPLGRKPPCRPPA